MTLPLGSAPWRWSSRASAPLGVDRRPLQTTSTDDASSRASVAASSSGGRAAPKWRAPCCSAVEHVVGLVLQRELHPVEPDVGESLLGTEPPRRATRARRRRTSPRCRGRAPGATGAGTCPSTATVVTAHRDAAAFSVLHLEQLFALAAPQRPGIGEEVDREQDQLVASAPHRTRSDAGVERVCDASGDEADVGPPGGPAGSAGVDAHPLGCDDEPGVGGAARRVTTSTPGTVVAL